MNDSIEFMAGQRLMLGFDGTQFNRDLAEIIRDFKAGGIILFARNIESPEQVAELCRKVQAFAASLGRPPLFISVDQEGGTVARLKAPYTEFPGNPHLDTIKAARHFAGITAGELKQSGINMNLAPVMDTAPEKGPSIMKDRVFKGGPEQVAELGCQVITTFQENGILACAKHFPGIGRTVLDSHFKLPVLSAPLSDLAEKDLVPFKAAIRVNVAAMMLSHIFYPQLDDTWQASLSPAIADRLLRREMGYRGLVLTDDLDMKAISHDIPTCVGQILKSGIDMALICHKGPNIQAAFEAMVRLMADDASLEKSGEICLKRILAYKHAYLGETDQALTRE